MARIDYNMPMTNTIFTFPSGLRLVYKHIPTVRSVGIAVMTACGSGNETLDNNGISHFIEHMMFKGTTSRTAFEIVDYVDSLGAQINAFTSKQTTCYYTISLDDIAPKCIEVLSDILFNSTFDEQELERERGVVLEEISMSEDDNADIVIDYLADAYFGDNPLGMTILGPRENINKFSRQNLIDYIKSNYVAQNTVVTIVGNMDYNMAKDLVREHFEGKFKSDNARIWQDKKYQGVPDYVYKFKDIEQSNIALAMPAYEYDHPNVMAMMIANFVLGGGMSSRLFQEIREKQGLAYNVYSYPSTYVNNGVMTLYIGTNLASVEKAVVSTKKLLQDMCKNGISEQEFTKAVQQLKTSYVLGQESTSSQMRVYAKNAIYTGELFDIDKRIQAVDSLTVDDINQVIKECFDVSKASISYVGKEIKSNLLDLLKG